MQLQWPPVPAQRYVDVYSRKRHVAFLVRHTHGLFGHVPIWRELYERWFDSSPGGFVVVRHIPCDEDDAFRAVGPHPMPSGDTFLHDYDSSYCLSQTFVGQPMPLTHLDAQVGAQIP